MIFTRIVAALFATAACAQAFHISNGKYSLEFEVSRKAAARELSERGLNHLNAVRDLAENNDVLVLSARDISTLNLRSEDVLSHIIVARTGTPPPGPYECTTKADCQQHITYATHQKAEAKKLVDKWRAELKAARKAKDEVAKRNAGNQLDSAQKSFEGWQERIEDYRDLMSHMSH